MLSLIATSVYPVAALQFGSKLGHPAAHLLSVSWFCGTATDRLFRADGAINDRETGKNCKCAAIMIVFRQNPGVV